MADSKRPSRFGRLAQLGGLTGRVTSKYVIERARSLVGRGADADARDRTHIDNAKDIVDTMSRLKGAAMKVGQQVAMFADNLDLPPEVAETLGKLHAEAEPVPFDAIRADIEEELEAPIETLFAQLDPEPLGTASLAQAHRAELPDGREVVVKVLHRGVDQTVTTDLMALKGILLSSRVAMRSKAELDDIFDEIRARLEEELDYLQEAANLAAYRRLYGDDPRVRIPAVHVALSTERVLTLDRLPGTHITRFLETASPEARQRAGQTLAEVYYEQVFRHRMLHADPHPGNYLFEPDGRVGILDFGCVKRFDEFWIGTYARAALAAMREDREATLEAAQDLGGWDGRGDKAADALWDFIRAMVEPLVAGPVQLGPEHENFLEEMRPVVMALLPHPNVRAPRDLVMLHRSLGGLYALNRRLGTTLDFGQAMRGQAAYAVARAEGRVS